MRSGRHFSALQEDTEAPGQKQPLRRYAAPAKRGRRSQQAVSAQEPEEKGDEQPEEQEEILAKRARRSAPANIPRESSAAKPEQEQLPAAKKTKRASRAAISDADAGELGGKQQPAALSGKRASRADVPQESPVEPEEATALQSKRGKCARSTKTSREEPEQAQPQAAKRTAAQPAQEHLQPAPGLAEEPEPSAMGGRRATRLGGAASQAQTPDRQLRASATRCALAYPRACVLRCLSIYVYRGVIGQFSDACIRIFFAEANPWAEGMSTRQGLWCK